MRQAAGGTVGRVMMVTLLITKAAGAVSRWLGRGGGQALPGLIAERLDPHIARKLAAQLPGGVIVVTGTNGKTTTTKLIAAALSARGERVLTNSTGSNLKRGVTSALLAAADLRGRIDATVGVFEVDEASLRLLSPELRPDHIVVLNLFRDQLDRYGELDATAALIGQGIAAAGPARVYLNADDPLVASLSAFAHEPSLVSYFGIDELPAASMPAATVTAADSDRCPKCRERLSFTTVFFSHLGHYACRGCGFARPSASVSISGVEHADLAGSSFTSVVAGERTGLRFPLPGTYNLYNALAMLSLAHGLGLAAHEVAESLAAAEAAYGRLEGVEVAGRCLYLVLVKNPAGCTQVLDTFLVGRPDTRVLFAINDFDADSKDVSWLWDVPVEALAVSGPVVFAAGTRGTDMALRLRYAGIAAPAFDDPAAAIDALVQATPHGGTAYVLSTYTAMLEMRKTLGRLATRGKVTS